MKKSWRLTEKILHGGKTIECRWYKQKRVPWNGVVAGDTLYFKDSGAPVTLRAIVARVVQHDHLTPSRVKELLIRYAILDGIEKKSISSFYKLFKDKKYCIIIYLKNPKKISPFEINKKGFGNMAAWISVRHISQIRK